jgi:hypothetical protein
MDVLIEPPLMLHQLGHEAIDFFRQRIVHGYSPNEQKMRISMHQDCLGWRPHVGQPLS